MVHKWLHRRAYGLIAVLLLLGVGLLPILWAHGDTLGSRKLQLSNNTVNALTEYTLTFGGQTASTVGSIRLQFCANDPLIGLPCTIPTGFAVNNATLTAQSGMGGFSIDTGNTTANVLVLTRTPGPSVPGNSSYTLTGVKNPDTPASYYVRLETFASNNASGSNIDYGGLAFAIASPITITAQVPPYMLFCVASKMPNLSCDTASGDFIDFGNLSAARTVSDVTKILVATNAENGYNVRAVGTTLTSGNNTIPALATADFSRIGISQFGLNLVANGTPSIGANPDGAGSGTVAANYSVSDKYRFVSGEVIAGGSGVEDYRRYTVSYVVNVAKSQEPGVYVSTMTFVSLANF